MFEREDWTLFRSLGTIGQKAGVPVKKLPALVLKELVDNALDARGGFKAGLQGNGFFVQDDGPGIDGTDEEIAALFSIRRPMTSSKLLRLPTRGALGNGLRVVAGVVLASGGSLQVTTRGRILRLIPKDDGSTFARSVPLAEECGGTRIEIRFNSALPECQIDDLTLDWADRAAKLADGESVYKGKTSPFWYDSDSFFELMRAAVGKTVVEVIGHFDGCAHPKAGKIAGGFSGRLATSLDRDEADVLLDRARHQARKVNPARLGCVGPVVEGFPASHAKEIGIFHRKGGRGHFVAELPFVLEAWAEVATKPEIQVSVNRTPITAELNMYHDKKDSTICIFGCGLKDWLEVGKRPIKLRLNIDTPYMPITTDGKSPDLSPLLLPIRRVVQKAVNRAKANAKGRPEGSSQKDVILGCLDEAIAKASEDGKYRFSLRQLFYAVRPHVIEACKKELGYGYFGQVIGDYEDDLGRDIPGIFRDSRGTLYHPHTGDLIPLGTLNVEKYRRPEWTFNKVLYSEKEGFFEVLRGVSWPERHDCALLTSKGFASRAARDVIDLLGETDEELTFYCIHDADASGTMIYQALVEATGARPARKVRIVNLGLEPEEGLAMGLQVESVERKGDNGKLAPVADYVPAEWKDWLQAKRVELNAMTTPQFLAWLDGKFEGQEGKVIPPTEVAVEKLEVEVIGQLNRRISAQILADARLDELVSEAFHARRHRIEAMRPTLRDDVRRSLDERQGDHWTAPVGVMAVEIADD